MLRLLRIPEQVEILGMDIVKIPATAYPEGMQSVLKGSGGSAVAAE
ncbi:MAG: hypothetical protein ACFB03_04180 [Paracoccaceae bacterium]